MGGLLWFCLCLGLSLWLASREGGAVLVAEDGQPVLATGDWLRHRDRLDDLMRQTLSRVMPGCRLLTMPGFSEQEARHYRVEGDGAPLRLALALQERLCQEALRTALTASACWPMTSPCRNCAGRTTGCWKPMWTAAPASSCISPAGRPCWPRFPGPCPNLLWCW